MATDRAPERLRFAPSPTGFFHVGGARTVLYNWLLARQSAGSLLLRIDDTDAERNREEWVDGILTAIEWLGLTWDEGPVRQSSRAERYQEVSENLFRSDAAYWCDCTRDAVLARSQPGQAPGYDGLCRDRNLGPGPGRALRFRVPRQESVTVTDLVRGVVTFPPGSIEDFVLVKSNGAPLYVLANAVDDIDYRITTVVRAEEHLPTTPKAVLLHEALRSPVPRFAHLPVLVNEARQKLSKRRDRVAVEDYRAIGILPEAMVNYLVLLGWSPGNDVEFLSREEMITQFSLEAVGHSPAFFDEHKLRHFNQHYLMGLPAQEFTDRATPHLVVTQWYSDSPTNHRTLQAIAPEIQTRVATLDDVATMVRFLFDYQPPTEDAIARLTPEAPTILKRAEVELAALESFDAETIEGTLRQLTNELDIPLRKLQAPVRLAVTGASVGPPLFSAMSILGPTTCIERILALHTRLVTAN
ncbi:MAG: glutamate--tRNA ligase [Ferrimicrobium sp.]